MEGDHGGAGVGEHADQVVHRADHQMHVDGRGDAVLAQGLQVQALRSKASPGSW